MKFIRQGGSRCTDRAGPRAGPLWLFPRQQVRQCVPARAYPVQRLQIERFVALQQNEAYGWTVHWGLLKSRHPLCRPSPKPQGLTGMGLPCPRAVALSQARSPALARFPPPRARAAGRTVEMADPRADAGRPSRRPIGGPRAWWRCSTKMADRMSCSLCPGRSLASWRRGASRRPLMLGNLPAAQSKFVGFGLAARKKCLPSFLII